MVFPQSVGILVHVRKSVLFHNLLHNEMRLPIANEIDTSVCFQHTSICAD
jgi:hypothetical protein